MTYQLTQDENCIKLIDDNDVVYWIPNDAGNKDWVAYQEWLAADPENQPEPAD